MSPITGLPDPLQLFQLKMELDVKHIKPHPFMNEYHVLAAMKPPEHPNVAQIWSTFAEEALSKKIIKKLPEYVHTIYADAKALDKEWIPRAQFTVMDWYPDDLAKLRPHFSTPLPWTTMIGWATDIAEAVLHLYRNKTAHLNLQLHNLLVANDGHVVLTNFSSAKRFKTKSMTVNYFEGLVPGGPLWALAPEVGAGRRVFCVCARVCCATLRTHLLCATGHHDVQPLRGAKGRRHSVPRTKRVGAGHGAV